MPGKVTYPVKQPEPDEPVGAKKTALEVAAGILVTDASGPEPVVAGHGDVEAVRFEDVEAESYNHLLARPELFHGTTEQRNIARYRLQKEGSQAAAQAAPTAATASPAASAEAEGTEGNLSPLAQRFADDPAAEAKVRMAIEELDAAAIEAAAIANLYENEAEVNAEIDSWQWEDEEPDEDESGEQS